MAEKDKIFYWIKLKKEFMDSETIDFLMSQKNGANYVVLYQMLIMKTINTNGKLCNEIGEMIIPFDAEKIQRDCKWFDIDTVRVAMEIYTKLGLIYKNEEGVFQIANFEDLVGSETYWANRKRIERQERKEIGQCPTGVQENVQETLISNISTLESNKSKSVIEIVEYLNKRANTHYKPTTATTKRHINARLEEGYTLEDFKTVIDKKTEEWLGTEYEKYLCPDTLFSSKFEKYLNQQVATKPLTYFQQKNKEYVEQNRKYLERDDTEEF